MTDDELSADLLARLRSPEADVRCDAAGALGALGGDGAAAVAPLYEACRDADARVRGEAAHSLWELACSCVGAFADAEAALVAGVPVLTALLDDPSSDVRASAARVLGELGTVWSNHDD